MFILLLSKLTFSGVSRVCDRISTAFTTVNVDVTDETKIATTILPRAIANRPLQIKREVRGAIVAYM